MPTVRIIGGQWRSRRIEFPDLPGLRPTQDSIRETLFNWLAPYISGAKCLDLFAGSGALGFEALSRGAKFCCFVDKHPQVLAKLHENCVKLLIPAEQYTILRAAVPYSLTIAETPYDIIFLDPPFQKNLLSPTLIHLTQSAYIYSGTLVYLEMEKNLDVILPPDWSLLRKKTTSSLTYSLVSASQQQATVSSNIR